MLRTANAQCYFRSLPSPHAPPQHTDSATSVHRTLHYNHITTPRACLPQPSRTMTTTTNTTAYTWTSTRHFLRDYITHIHNYSYHSQYYDHHHHCEYHHHPRLLVRKTKRVPVPSLSVRSNRVGTSPTTTTLSLPLYH